MAGLARAIHDLCRYAAAVAKATGTPSSYAAGSRVFHQKFGPGTVALVDGNKPIGTVKSICTVKSIYRQAGWSND
ncbi:MAG TPA: hypothetical protein VF744_19565 [Beijerinckiaceae bacterium]|jgi:hypothetical protein